MPRLMFIGLMLFAAVLGGCAAKGPLPLESQVSRIQVGQTTSTEVLDSLSQEGMLHSANSVSVLSDKGWASELVVIQFDEVDSTVGRKVYVQVRSQRNLFSTKEMLHLTVQAEFSDALLEEPYEDDMRKKVALLSAIHQWIIEDTRPLKEDQQTVSLMGMARSALGVGIQKLKSQPRQAGQLDRPSGFSYYHPTLGGVNLLLSMDSEKIYTMSLWASDKVDLVNNW